MELEPKIEAVLSRLDNYKRTHSDAYNIPREEAEFLYLLINAKKPRRLLELGTSIGYSGIWLGLAAKGCKGKLTTMELNPKKIEVAKRNFAQAGLGKTIKIIEGDINAELKKLKGKFDFVFMDTEKEEYLNQFRIYFPKLRRGAIIAADNAGNLASHMKDYLQHVRASKGLASVFVPLGNGVELTLKK